MWETNNSTENDASSIKSGNIKRVASPSNLLTTIPYSDSPGPEKDFFTTGAEGGFQDPEERLELTEDTEEKMNKMEEKVASLEKLVISLASQVTCLSGKVEDYSFENGLLSETVNLQLVRAMSFMVFTVNDM